MKDKKQILYNYVLAFMLLMGYYLGDFLGITTWAFKQNIFILLTALTLYYGTYITVIKYVFLDKLFKRK